MFSHLNVKSCSALCALFSPRQTFLIAWHNDFKENHSEFPIVLCSLIYIWAHASWHTSVSWSFSFQQNNNPYITFKHSSNEIKKKLNSSNQKTTFQFSSIQFICSIEFQLNFSSPFIYNHPCLTSFKLIHASLSLML